MTPAAGMLLSNARLHSGPSPIADNDQRRIFPRLDHEGVAIVPFHHQLFQIAEFELAHRTVGQGGYGRHHRTCPVFTHLSGNGGGEHQAFGGNDRGGVYVG